MAFNPLFSPKVIQLSLLGFLFDDTVFYAMTSLQKFAPLRRLSPRSEPHGADMLRAPRGTPDLPAGVNGLAPANGFGRSGSSVRLDVKPGGCRPALKTRPVSPKLANCHSAPRGRCQRCPAEHAEMFGGCGRAPDRALTLWEKRLLIKHIRWQQTQLIT
jgi:hypothetical protein